MAITGPGTNDGKIYRTEEGNYHRALMCDIISLSYNFDEKELLLYFPEGQCCDMSAAIRIAEGIDKDARQIQTFAGNIPDTVYNFVGKIWVAATITGIRKKT